MIYKTKSGAYNRRFSARRLKVLMGDDASCYSSWPEVASDQGRNGQNSCPRGLNRAGQNGQKSDKKVSFSLGNVAFWPFCLLAKGVASIYINYIYVYLCPYIHTHYTHTCAYVRTRGLVRLCG
jgi:hypothetical protein